MTQLLEACIIVKSYQTDTRKETTVFISPVSLFSEDVLLLLTWYGYYTGKNSNKLVHSK